MRVELIFCLIKIIISITDNYFIFLGMDFIKYLNNIYQILYIIFSWKVSC